MVAVFLQVYVCLKSELWASLIGESWSQLTFVARRFIYQDMVSQWWQSLHKSIRITGIRLRWKNESTHFTKGTSIITILQKFTNRSEDWYNSILPASRNIGSAHHRPIFVHLPPPRHFSSSSPLPPSISLHDNPDHPLRRSSSGSLLCSEVVGLSKGLDLALLSVLWSNSSAMTHTSTFYPPYSWAYSPQLLSALPYPLPYIFWNNWM